MENLHPALASVDVLGAPLTASSRVIVILHGVGGNDDKLGAFAQRAIGRDASVTILAPRSAFKIWFEGDLGAPPSPTAPDLLRALGAVEWLVRQALEAGVPPDRITVSGFSQGACLALEHAMRAGRRYRGVMAMSGALLGMAAKRGDPRRAWGYSDATHLAGVRTKLSGHDDDAKVPLAIIKRTQRQLAKLGAEVALRTEPGAMHGLMQADCPVMGTLVEEGV